MMRVGVSLSPECRLCVVRQTRLIRVITSRTQKTAANAHSLDMADQGTETHPLEHGKTLRVGAHPPILS